MTGLRYEFDRSENYQYEYLSLKVSDIKCILESKVVLWH